MKIFLAILMIAIATPVMAGHIYSHSSYNQDNEDLQRRNEELQRRNDELEHKYIRERALRAREQDYSPGFQPNLGGGNRSYPGESLRNERKSNCRSPLCE